MDKELMDFLQQQFDGINKRFEQIDKRFVELQNEVSEIKNIQREHGGKLDTLIEFATNSEISFERIDTRLKKMDDNIKVLAADDFDIRSGILSVKEELRIIKGGKE